MATYTLSTLSCKDLKELGITSRPAVKRAEELRDKTLTPSSYKEYIQEYCNGVWFGCSYRQERAG